MQIAETLVKQGMTGDTRFNDELTNLILTRQISRVIETGTYLGLGTTKAIIKGLTGNFHPFEFCSIECNPEHHKQAVKNIGKITGVHLMCGLSVSHDEKPTSMTYDLPDYIVVDHTEENRNNLYTKEVSYPVPDNLLEMAFLKMSGHPELIMLDSAGHMGFIEFKYVMKRASESFILALDDTCHLKHYETMQYIKAHPEKFTIIKEVESKYIDPVHGSKFGYSIIEVNGL